jgi:hypothetical protein
MSRIGASAFTASERHDEPIGTIKDFAERAMAARTGVSIRIDTGHARAICDEIGDRLRACLDREMPEGLPARLQELVDRLAAADHRTAPSIVPSLDDMTGAELPIPSR